MCIYIYIDVALNRRTTAGHDDHALPKDEHVNKHFSSTILERAEGYHNKYLFLYMVSGAQMLFW